MVEVKGSRRVGKSYMAEVLSQKEKRVVRYFKYRKAKDNAFKSATQSILGMSNFVSYLADREKEFIKYWVFNKDDEIEKRFIFFLSGSPNDALRNILNEIRSYVKSLDMIIFEDMEVSDEVVNSIKKEFDYNYNLKQIFIFNSSPLKRKQYVVELNEVDKELDLKMKKSMSERSYRQEIKLIGYKEVDDLPTYNYRCKCCGHEFKKVQKISEDPLKRCLECGGELERIFKKPPGIQFKGSGFYSNS